MLRELCVRLQTQLKAIKAENVWLGIFLIKQQLTNILCLMIFQSQRLIKQTRISHERFCSPSCHVLQQIRMKLLKTGSEWIVILINGLWIVWRHKARGHPRTLSCGETFLMKFYCVFPHYEVTSRTPKRHIWAHKSLNFISTAPGPFSVTFSPLM